MNESFLLKQSGNINNPIVVTSILKNNSEILILQRSNEVKSMQREWAGISGYYEENEDLLSRALIEIYEETQITKNDLILRKIFDQIHIHIRNDIVLIVQPICFYSTTKKVVLNWEHSRYQWIKENEIDKFNFVPKLKSILLRCFKMNNNDSS